MSPTGAVRSSSVPSRYFQPESAERFPKGLVTELLHNGSYVLLTACAFDLQKLLKPRENQVRCEAPVPASMLRNRYTSVCNLPTNLCFHVLREEAVLTIQLLFQIRNQFLQAFFCEGLLNPNFEFGSADLRLRRHINHYDKNARKVSFYSCDLVNEGKQKSGAYAPPGQGLVLSHALPRVQVGCSTALVELPASPHDGWIFARSCSTGLNSGRP